MPQCTPAHRPESNGQHTLEPVGRGLFPVPAIRQSNVKKHQRSSIPATRSRQEEADRRAVERAENEGMVCSAVACRHPAPNDDLRPWRPSAWLDAGTIDSADTR